VGVRTLPTEPVYTTCRSSMRARVRSAHARRTAPSKQIARMVPQRRHLSLCGSTHATEGPSTCRLSMQHACTSAEGPRTTSGAEQANRTNGATATPLELVWVYPRYPLSPYIPPVYAACVYECGAPTHDERRRASKSHQIGWRIIDAAGARVGLRTLPTEPAYTTCRCSMRVRVRSAHARRAAPCKQIARMVPRRRQ
jgi:hypothetical protein